MSEFSDGIERLSGKELTDSEKLDRLLVLAEKTAEIVDTFIAEAKPILGELKPTVDALMTSPMIKMLVGKRKG